MIPEHAQITCVIPVRNEADGLDVLAAPWQVAAGRMGAG
jgi:hypothetical protein